MEKQKRIDPRIIILILIYIIYMFIKFMINTYCLQYQLAQVPNELSLSSYSIEAGNNEEAILKVKEILNNNNLNSDNYIITITDNNLIKIEAGNIEETQETINEETENLIETPEGGINVLIDYTANKEFITTNQEKIYLPEEIINSGYKYLFIYKSTSASGYNYYFCNEYEVTGYGSTGKPNKILFKEAMKIINGSGTTISNILKENANLSATVYEEKEISIFGVDIINFNLYNQDGTTYKEANINITITEEPEEPTTPEEPTEPENPETNIDYTEQLKEVNSNLEEIKNLLLAIIIMCGFGFMVSFTRSMFR